MSLKLVIKDLTTLSVDTIINPVNTNLIPTGGVDLRIHDLMGETLKSEIKIHAPLDVANSFIIKATNQSFKHIIFLSVPVYSLNKMVERMLYICYSNALKLAKDNGFKSVGFPLLSSGENKFPKDIELNIATQAINDFLEENEMDIYLTLFDNESISLLKESKYKSLLNYLEENQEEVSQAMPTQLFSMQASITKDVQDQILNPDLSFSYYLYEIIQNKKINEVDLYKKANIDRKLFSKIMSSGTYQPSKSTAILLALALELNIDQTLDLLGRAGYTLSPALKNDLVIKWCIKNKIFNVYEVCEILLELGLKSLI